MVIGGISMTGSFGLEQRICDAESKCLSCGAPLPESRADQRRFTGGQTSILVLGENQVEGRHLADRLLEQVNNAIQLSGKNIIVDLVMEPQVIESYNVRKLPALIINGSIVSQGIVSDADEILGEIEFLA